MRAADYAFFQPRFIAMAHRGGYVDPAEADRENTLYAFAEAMALGYTYLETDVHLTRDGVLVAFHDDHLDRLTEHTGRIADITLAELNRDRPDSLGRVPTLDELFEALPTARFNIDMKADATVAPLAAAIRAHQAEDRVCVASFGQTRLRDFRRLAGPAVATSASLPGVMWHMLPFLPDVHPGPAVALQVPLTRSLAGVPVHVFSPALVARAHARGLRLQVWTIDDPDEMDRLIDAGVDGLVTNRIDVLKEVLVRRGLWL